MEWVLYAALGMAIAATVSLVGTGITGACWLPTPTDELEQILKDVQLRPGELFVDIGCGDGRTLITAAQKCGARCVGIEIDPLKVFIARWRVRRAGVADKVTVIRASALQADLRGADVVFFYLSHQLIDKLKPKFQAELAPGARIISFGFMVSGFPLVKTDARKKWFIYRIGTGQNLDRYS